MITRTRNRGTENEDLIIQPQAISGSIEVTPQRRADRGSFMKNSN